MGFCKVCSKHVPLDSLYKTSNNEFFCKNPACKNLNIVNQAQAADATARSKKRAKKDPNAPKKITKVSLILDFIQNRDTFTVAEVAAACGHDLKNASVSLTILKNPDRTKNVIPFHYNHATKLWTRNGFVPPANTPEPAAPVPSTAQAAEGTADTPQA